MLMRLRPPILKLTDSRLPCTTLFGSDDEQRQRQSDERAASRKRQVGSGDRSERIRTYNLPQGRVTDHHINLTLYKLERVLAGEALDELIGPLVAADQAEKLAELQ